MPRSVAITVENNFVKGLLTETTGLNSPENSCIETYNCVFDKTGEVHRRPGFDLEPNYALNSASLVNNAISEYVWRGAALTGEIIFCVVQIGAVIYFYRSDAAGTLSQGLKSFTFDLTPYKISGSPPITEVQCDYAAGNGMLFVAHPYCTPVAIEYNATTDTITPTGIDIKIRDLKGVANSQVGGSIPNVVDRISPSNVTSNILYNLYNQGWRGNQLCTTNNKDWFINPTLAFFIAQQGSFPAEVEIPWSYKAPLFPPTNEGTILTGVPQEAFSALELYSPSKFGSTPAPKGYYTLQAFLQNRSGAAAGEDPSPTGLPIVTSGYQRPCQIAFYAGRVFFGGVAANGFNTKIYFSQILDGTSNLDKCYQQSDPTSEENNDLLPTDGGFLEIPEMSQVVKMLNFGSSLLVWATNGVWSISGSEGIGFTATDYKVDRLSDIGALGNQSFVVVEGTPIWWNADGIYTLKQQIAGSTPQVENLSNTTIQTFFRAIPQSSKQYAKGAYNSSTKRIQWVYRSTAEAGISNRYNYDRVLNLDVNTGAFYPWSMPEGNSRVCGIVSLKGHGSTPGAVPVTVSGSLVTVGGSNVTVTETVTTEVTQTFKFLVRTSVVAPERLTFGEASNVVLTDWLTSNLNGIDYSSYFIPHNAVRGEGIRKFQSNYLRFWAKHTESSMFDVTPRWDFSLDSDTGRWGNTQRIEMGLGEGSYGFASKRLKIRGHGFALTFKINSVGQEPFNIVGWSAFESGNNAP